MMQVSGIYTVGGLMMLLFLSACAAAGGKGDEGPTPCVSDNLAVEPDSVLDDSRCGSDEDIPLAR